MWKSKKLNLRKQFDIVKIFLIFIYLLCVGNKIKFIIIFNYKYYM